MSIGKKGRKKSKSTDMQGPSLQPAQLLDSRFYQNFFQSAFGCCTRSRDESDAEVRPDIGSQMIRFLGFPQEPIKVDLGEMAQQILAKVQPSTGTDTLPTERKIPVWEQDPTPLQGWSETDQRLFILAAKEAKLKSSLETSRLRRKLEKISRKFPGKSIGDCERCFHHVEKSRIAYFGPKDE